jgi:hypothetical protein
MDERQQRMAQNELLFRHVNEQIQALDTRLGVTGGDLQRFLCECGDAQCTDRVELTVEEYERAHDEPATFAIVDGHQDPRVETVVERSDRFSVVRKKDGGPAEYVARHDGDADRG